MNKAITKYNGFLKHWGGFQDFEKMVEQHLMQTEEPDYCALKARRLMNIVLGINATFNFRCDRQELDLRAATIAASVCGYRYNAPNAYVDNQSHLKILQSVKNMQTGMPFEILDFFILALMAVKHGFEQASAISEQSLMEGLEIETFATLMITRPKAISNGVVN